MADDKDTEAPREDDRNDELPAPATADPELGVEAVDDPERISRFSLQRAGKRSPMVGEMFS
jgi:hypothetical protein